MMRDRTDKHFVSGAVYTCRMLPSLDAKTEIPLAHHMVERMMGPPVQSPGAPLKGLRI